MQGRAVLLRLAPLLVVVLSTVLAVLTLLAQGCGSEPQRLTRPQGSALLVAPADLGRLTAEDREALRLGEVRELFLEAATLEEGEGAVPVVTPLPGFAGGAGLPASVRLPVTLVVRGPWPAAADPEVAPAALAGDLRRLRRTAEDAGLVVAGYHLDGRLPEGEDALRRQGRTLGLVRRVMDEGLFLSLSVGPGTLSSAGVAPLVAGVDFVVAFLYGPRPDGGPDPGFRRGWELSAVDDGVARLRRLEMPFLLGIGTVGHLHRLDDAGLPAESTPLASLAELLSHRDLAPDPASVLEAADRQTYDFGVRRPTTLGEWRLARGEELRVTRLSTHHLRRAAATAEAIAPLLHLGELFDRLPRPGEELSLTAAGLAGAALGSAAGPEPEVEVAAAGGPSRFRVTLVNRSSQETEVSMLDNNYVELRAVGGAVFSNVDPGEFPRFSLERDGMPVANMQALRNADGLKLSVPLLDGGQRVESGLITLRGADREPTLMVTGRFLLPTGEQLELPERPWPAPAGAATGGADTP